jgi:hypothetical protein
MTISPNQLPRAADAVTVQLTRADAAMLAPVLWALLDAVDGESEALDDIPGAVDAVDRLALTIHNAAKDSAL